MPVALPPPAMVVGFWLPDRADLLDVGATSCDKVTMKNFYRVTMTIQTTKNTAAVTAVASYTRGERQRGTGCDDQLRLGGGLELDYQAVVEALRRWLEVTAWEVGDDRAAEVLQGWAQLQLAGMGPQDGEPF